MTQPLLSPKEEARYLYNKFYNTNSHSNSISTRMYIAIKSALVCVGEILEVTKEPVLLMGGVNGYDYNDYWLEVKDEIEKLYISGIVVVNEPV